MKKIGIFLISLMFFSSITAWGTNKNEGNVNAVDEINLRPPHRQMMPSHGGRGRMAQGIEGRKVTFGFNIGGGISMMDAVSREKANFGSKFNVFVYGLIPNTKTFAIGFEGGVTVLFAGRDKFRQSLESTNRDRQLFEGQKPMGSVGDWILPTAQLSFMGNFHPMQRFNVQVKVNLGGVFAMTPRYNADFSILETRGDGLQEIVQYRYRYEDDLCPGFSATLGAKLLYALTAHAEFGIGLDWSYMRFQYTKVQTLPLGERNRPVKTQTISQFGFLDLHIGFAFNF